MGDVYRARDSRLGRDVALKVLPPDVTHDPERLERFDREARAIAALNHPHIVTIYSTEESGGTRFLTMELVEGTTLTETIAPAGLSVARFLEIAIPLADALAAAHQKQITHRDLKPANVMISHDGRVKVLDFGLARVGGSEVREHSFLATQAPLTQQGMIVGTMPYMSPEQVEGRAPDPRSDLFSLGVMCYEMLTGERPFTGPSSPALMSAILRDTPPAMRDRRPDVPDDLARLIARCIEKRPEERVQTARDVFNELRHVQKQIESGQIRLSSGRRGAAEVTESLWIAVLPFSVRGADTESGELAAGLTEDITAGLSKFQGLAVLAPQSARVYRDSPLDVRQIAERLNARYIVGGSVRKSPSSVRVSVQLIDVESGAHLWSETYDRSLGDSDLFAIQDDVTDHIVATIADQSGVLAKSMVHAVRQHASLAESTSGQLLLRASGFQHNPTPPDHAALRAAFQLRLEEQPDNAHLWAQLAHLYIDEHSLWFNALPDPLGRALKASRRAIELDQGNQDGWKNLALTCFYLHDQRGMEEASQRAIRLNPRNANTLAWMGNILTHAGEYDRGCALTERAMEINTGHPGWLHFAIFNRHFARGEWADALRAARRVNIPEFMWMQFAIAAATGHLGLAGEARAAADAMTRIAPLLEDPNNLREFVVRWYWPEELIESLLEGVSIARSLDAAASPTDRAVPRSTVNPASSSSGSASAIARHSPGMWVAVMPFASRSGDEDSRVLADGLTDDITTGLSRFGYLRVVSRAAAERLAKAPSSAHSPDAQPGARYVLEGTVRKVGSAVRVGVRLVDAHTAANLWAENLDRDAAAGTFAVQDDIANRIVATVGDQTGVLVKAMADTLVDTPIEELGVEELAVRYHVYTEHYRVEEHALLRDALERMVEREPKSAEAWALMANLYEHEHSHALNARPDSVGRQRRAAERALELDPRSQEAWVAVASTKVFAHDLAGLPGAVERAVSINPLNADQVALCAIFLSATGNYDRSTELIHTAILNKPQHPGWYHFPRFAAHFHKREDEEALREVKQVNMPMMPLAHMSAAAAAGQLGRVSDARLALDALRTIDPSLLNPGRARDAWGIWICDHERLDRLVDGFEKAIALTERDPRSTPSSGAQAPSGSLRAGLAVTVRPFACSESDHATRAIADGLTADVATGLARFSYVRLIAGPTAEHAGAPAARYVVEGDVRTSGRSLRINARLVDVTTGVHVWSDVYNRDATADAFALVDDVASRVAATIADGNGALLREFASTITDERDAAALSILLRFNAYARHFTADVHAQLRDVVAALVEREPHNSGAWTYLALLCTHEVLFGFNLLPDALERARQATDRAIAIDSATQGAWTARAMVAFLDRDLTEFRTAVDRAIELNPLHTGTVATSGLLIASVGDTARGAELVGRAMSLNPHHPGWYHIALFLDAYRKGDADAALMHAKRITMPHIPTAALFAIAGAGQFGRAADARFGLSALQRSHAELLDPQRAREALARWMWDGELLDSVVEGFEKALALGASAG
jgi:serine/threonine-protein kinase